MHPALVDAVTEGLARPRLLQRIGALESVLAEAYRHNVADLQVALTRGTDPEALETACPGSNAWATSNPCTPPQRHRQNPRNPAKANPQISTRS